MAVRLCMECTLYCELVPWIDLWAPTLAGSKLKLCGTRFVLTVAAAKASISSVAKTGADNSDSEFEAGMMNSLIDTDEHMPCTCCNIVASMP